MADSAVSFYSIFSYSSGESEEEVMQNHDPTSAVPNPDRTAGSVARWNKEDADDILTEFRELMLATRLDVREARLIPLFQKLRERFSEKQIMNKIQWIKKKTFF